MESHTVDMDKTLDVKNLISDIDEEACKGMKKFLGQERFQVKLASTIDLFNYKQNKVHGCDRSILVFDMRSRERFMPSHVE